MKCEVDLRVWCFITYWDTLKHVGNTKLKNKIMTLKFLARTLRPCQGRPPRRKYMNMYPSASRSSLLLCSENSGCQHVKAICLCYSGACTGFLKGVGEESAQGAGSEATEAGARGRTAQPPENFNWIIC